MEYNFPNILQLSNLLHDVIYIIKYITAIVSFLRINLLSGKIYSYRIFLNMEFKLSNNSQLSNFSQVGTYLLE